MGGSPRIDPTRWPRSQCGEPLHHVAQIDLDDVPPGPWTADLRDRGTLSFFVGSPDDSDSPPAAVVFVPEGEGPLPCEPPEDCPAIDCDGAERNPRRSYRRWPVRMTDLRFLAGGMPAAEVVTYADGLGSKPDFHIFPNRHGDTASRVDPAEFAWDSAQRLIAVARRSAADASGEPRFSPALVSHRIAQFERARPAREARLREAIEQFEKADKVLRLHRRGRLPRRLLTMHPWLRRLIARVSGASNAGQSDVNLDLCERTLEQCGKKVKAWRATLAEEGPTFQSCWNEHTRAVAEHRARRARMAKFVHQWESRADAQDPWSPLGADGEALERDADMTWTVGAGGTSYLRESASRSLRDMMTGERRAYDAIPKRLRDYVEGERLRSAYGGAWHQMFGVPCDVQDTVGDHVEEVMLLQLGSDDMMDWLWADAGILHFWISPVALRAGCWSEAYATLVGH